MLQFHNKMNFIFSTWRRDLTFLLLLLICVTLGLTGFLNLILDKSLHRINKHIPETSPCTADHRVYSRKEEK
jgi:hypothetical protein